MRDLILMLLVAGFFMATTAYIGACARLSATTDRDLDAAAQPADGHPDSTRATGPERAEVPA